MATKKTNNSKNTSAVDNTAEDVLKNGQGKEKKDSKVLKLMTTLGVSTLWKNSREEYFTEKSLALASEDGNKENIKEYKR